MSARLLTAMAACAAAAAVAGMMPAPAIAATGTRAGSAVTRDSREAKATGGPQAGEVTPSAVQLPALVSATPVSWTPNVFAGSSKCNTQWFGANCAPSTVTATAVVNGEVVVAGAFTQACVPGPASDGNCTPGTLVTRNDIFAYQLGTGTIDPDFVPVLDQGPVNALAAGPGDTVYAGGSFTTVNGAAHEGVVQLSVTPGKSSDGQVVSGFGGQLAGYANALAFNGNALYVGGHFTSADGTPATGIARLNATTGALDSSFTFTLSHQISGTSLLVGTIALSPDGSHLAIGGSFLQVDGRSQPRIAMIDTGGGLGAAATLASWSSPLLANDCSNEHDYVNDIDFSPDGSFFVVVTTGFHSAGGPAICDAASRFETGASGTDVQPTWVNYTGGDTLHSVAVTGSVVYIGGHNRWVNNECGSNGVCEANAVLVDGISALDADTGLALPWWHPGTLRGVGVDTLTSFPAGASPDLSGGLILGTNTGTVDGSFHGENALFPLTTTAAQAPGGPILSGMFSQGRIGGSEGSSSGVAAMCVDDADNSSASGAPVELETCVNDNEQNWAIGPDGTIQLNGLCLDTENGGTSSGTPVVMDACSGASSQQWRPGSGDSLVNQASDMCLDDPGASTSNGIQLQISSCDGVIQQAWPLPVAQAPPPPPPTGTVNSVLVPKSSNVPCMTDPNDVSKPGTLVELWSCVKGAAQNWTVESNGTIQIKGRCLDTSGGGTASGTPVVIGTCDGSASQVWTPGSSYTLVNQAAGICLSDPGSNTANGTQLQIQACSGRTNQQWRLPAV